jgi:hypothetical protein
MLLFNQPIQRRAPFLFKEPDYSEIHKIAEGLERRLKIAFLQAVAGLGEGIAKTRLESALLSGNVGLVIKALSFKEFEADLTASIAKILSEGAKKGAKEGIKNLPAKAQSSLRFDLVNSRAVAWAESHSAKLITQVSNETKDAVRVIIKSAQSEGITIQRQAQLIRAHVGLTEGGANAVAKMRQRLLAEENKNADRLTQRYSQKLINARARTIARTETLNSSNNGLLVGWREAQSQNLLSSTAKKKWIITPMESCKLCLSVAGETVVLDSLFSNGYDAPTRHPRCRCTMGLVFD